MISDAAQQSQHSSPIRPEHKHSLRSNMLPAIQPRLEKLCNAYESAELTEQPGRRYNRQYFRIPTNLNDKPDNTDKEILMQLQSYTDEPYEDQKPKEFVGENAIRQYNNAYKKIARIKEQNKFINVQSSAHTSVITRIEKLKLMPCKMGLVKLKGDKQVLSIQNQKFGDRYIEGLTEGLRTLPLVQDFNLSQNRIKEAGASIILPVISKQARSIELLSNQIGRKGLDPMIATLLLQNCKIQILNLEDNELGDQSIQDLCKAVGKNTSIEKLNISKNLISNKSYPYIKTMLEENDSLIELYLHWNSIKGNGGQEIFKVLASNKTMKVLDLSYNLLGVGPSVAETLKEFFMQNKTMLHLDLSANGFPIQDCQIISEALSLNHTIYGFHFAGNFGYVDTKGFLVFENTHRNYNKIRVEQRIKGVDFNGKPYSKAVRSEKIKDTCWICDGYQAATFTWIPNESGSAAEEPIFIHYDYEGYEAIFLGKANDKGQFSTHRMIPSGPLNYFYTANQMQVVNSKEPIVTHNEKFTVKVKIVDQLIDVMMEETNFQQFKPATVIHDYDPIFDVLPRTPDPIYIPAKNKKAKRIWTYPISIWAPKYKFENEEQLRKCFEKDWLCCKIPKFVKKQEEVDQIKELLWQAYRPIKETYKNYASYNPNGDVFSISQNPMSELMNQCGLIDGKILKIADVDLKFISTNSASGPDWKGNYRNPERAIIRYQLMEFLVRIAEDKYVRPNPGVSMVQATKQVLEQCMPHFQMFDCHRWRMEKYYVEQCDDIVKKYKQVFDYIYMQNSKKKVKPGQPPFMCLEELRDVCNKLNLYDENFVDRDVNLAFNLSMQSVVDELETDRLFQMQPIEFWEAMARVADKVSLIPIGRENEVLINVSQDWTYETRSQQPLYYKLEALMILLIKQCVDDETKKNWKIPTISMFDVVEQDEYY